MNASAQTYGINMLITPLVFANSGGGSLTDCSADSLPAGLQVAVSTDSLTCEISGTPTALQETTTHTITATNASGNSSATVDVDILAEPLLTAPSQFYHIDSAILPLSFTNSGGGSLTDCSADSLPAGLQVAISTDSSTCEISGTPTAFQAVTAHTITATNVSGSGVVMVDMTIIEVQTPFITQWKTDNPGATNDDQVIISASPNFTYNYQVNWGDGSSDSNVTGDITHTYASAGTYTVEISGDYPQNYFGFSGDDPEKLLSIEQWGNSVWHSMGDAFKGCRNLVVNATDIPDLSRVTNMSRMFLNARAFNQAIGNWDVSSVTDMSLMFWNTIAFNQDIGSWDVSSVTDMSLMFQGGSFNGAIDNWDVSSVTNMNGMFWNANDFNQDISSWDVSSVTDMKRMFQSANNFNQAIDNWDVSSVTDMNATFSFALVFNQAIDNWNVSSVIDMSLMFANARTFDQAIDNWNVSSVTDMSGMFERARVFNQAIDNWDVSSVTDMSGMFSGAAVFNQDIGSWDVSSVTDINNMFRNADAFNGAIDNWDVSSVTDMSNMFWNANDFNQDIGSWDVSSVTDMNNMFENVALSMANYDALLGGWSQLSLQNDVVFNAGNSTYSSPFQTARDILTNTFNWTVSDGGVQ